VRWVPDVVIGNSGLNSIQLFDDSVWEKEHRANVPNLAELVADLVLTRSHQQCNSSSAPLAGVAAGESKGGGPVFVWHLTTPVCENQPHFRRYRYNAKHWRYRSITAINRAVETSNGFARHAMEQAAEMIASKRASSCGGTMPYRSDILLLDGWSMVVGGSTNSSGRLGAGGWVRRLCPFYDDPLHHRFMDREMVQVLLNYICESGDATETRARF
jgi:hypothetical protein